MAPKKNKPAPRNAFYYFMIEFKDQHGRKFNSLKDAAEAASPHWNRLTKEQKQPYEERARSERSLASRLTSDGLSVDEIEKNEQLERQKEQNMRDDIKGTLKIASDQGHIQDDLFFIIHINTFCYCTSEKRYYPAEIAVSCFSLEDGVLPQNVFHKIIKPGALPLGYASEAKLISDQTHLIPIPGPGDYESNVAEVYEELKLFLSTKLLGSQRFPPLYTDEKMLKMVQNILDTWCDDYGEERPLFKVYNLQYMFMVLRNMVAKNIIWPTETYSAREIDKDVYTYSCGLICSLHERADEFQHCSRSVVIRYAYIICDNCCKDLNIPLIPGTHIPDMSATLNKGGSKSSSVSNLYSDSSRSSSRASSSRWKSVRDDDTDTVVSFSSKSEWGNQSVLSETSTNNERSVQTNSQPRFFSDMSSERSYAGATGRYRNASQFGGNSQGTEYASLPGNGNVNFLTNDKEFPSLMGRGRGSSRGYQRRN